MGWTGSQYFGKSRKDFVIKEFTSENEENKYYLTDISMRGAVAYCISWKENKVTGDKLHEGLVILTEKRRNDGYWVYYKEMGETVLPYYFNAPVSLIKKLNALGEPFNDNAKQWREQCLTNASKANVKLEFGQTIQFASKFKFPSIGLEEDTFEYAEFRNKRNIFVARSNGHMVCLPDWRKKEFTVLGVVQNI